MTMTSLRYKPLKNDKHLSETEVVVVLYKSLFEKERLQKLTKWEAGFLTNIWDSYYSVGRAHLLTVESNNSLQAVLLKRRY
jgi:hypothetical protein